MAPFLESGTELGRWSGGGQPQCDGMLGDTETQLRNDYRRGFARGWHLKGVCRKDCQKADSKF